MWTSIRSLTLAAALLLGAAPALADPSGHYTIAGTNPDGSTYDASVLVAKVGDTFTLTYTLQDGTKLQGTGIGDDDVMAIVNEFSNTCRHHAHAIFQNFDFLGYTNLHVQLP